jgi:hypothetical protein
MHPGNLTPPTAKGLVEAAPGDPPAGPDVRGVRAAAIPAHLEGGAVVTPVRSGNAAAVTLELFGSVVVVTPAHSAEVATPDVEAASAGSLEVVSPVGEAA